MPGQLRGLLGLANVAGPIMGFDRLIQGQLDSIAAERERRQKQFENDISLRKQVTSEDAETRQRDEFTQKLDEWMQLAGQRRATLGYTQAQTDKLNREPEEDRLAHERALATAAAKPEALGSDDRQSLGRYAQMIGKVLQAPGEAFDPAKHLTYREEQWYRHHLKDKPQFFVTSMEVSPGVTATALVDQLTGKVYPGIRGDGVPTVPSLRPPDDYLPEGAPSVPPSGGGAAPVAPVAPPRGAAAPGLGYGPGDIARAAAPTASVDVRVGRENALPVLESLVRLSDEAIRGQQGLQGLVEGTQAWLGAKANLDAYAKTYDRMARGAVSMLAKASGQSGVLSNQDIENAITMLPTVFDSRETARMSWEEILRILRYSEAERAQVLGNTNWGIPAADPARGGAGRSGGAGGGGTTGGTTTTTTPLPQWDYIAGRGWVQRGGGG